MLILGCAAHVKEPSTRSNMAACARSCEQRADTCEKFCRNSCQQCRDLSLQRAAQHYSQYVHEELVEGGAILRNLNSYQNPLQCRKTTCNCRADYRVCIQSCGGVIRKSLQAAPVC
jgi:hypothetical protein